MLNGRNFVSNDFTCSTVNGHSVVGYCIVNHDDLSTFIDFTVSNIPDIINSVGHETILTSASFPDHSVLSWKLNFGIVEQLPSSMNKSNEQTEYKIDTRNIPSDFLMHESVVTCLHETVFR